MAHARFKKKGQMDRLSLQISLSWRILHQKSPICSTFPYILLASLSSTKWCSSRRFRVRELEGSTRWLGCRSSDDMIKAVSHRQLNVCAIWWRWDCHVSTTATKARLGQTFMDSKGRRAVISGSQSSSSSSSESIGWVQWMVAAVWPFRNGDDEAVGHMICP